MKASRVTGVVETVGKALKGPLIGDIIAS